ncbi:hypothetical protein IWW45_005490 [Coemansia sp. RSA 485]|nr:hypothetical protein IWW45_005490 [Coemansia sp. RSA 485]
MSCSNSENHHRYVHALNELDDVNIKRIRPLIPPQILMEDLPLTESAAATIVKGRQAAEAIVQGKDDRLLVIVGPCSIHNTTAALEYADNLSAYAETAGDDLCIIMRVYFEKPRTTVGWKGLINDPDLNGNYAINKGLRKARTLLLDISEKGLPAGCELLDTISPQYIGDLISWGAIGARTTESQVHRELSSGMSVPIGFKNGTDGNVKIAVDAIKSAESSHCFLSVTKQGLSAIVETQGNKHCHIILRGGGDGPNYEEKYVSSYVAQLQKSGVNPRLMIDCSHGNSSKDFRKQPIVSDNIAHQLSATETGKYIAGVMIESNLVEGNQSIPKDSDLSKLVYGKSVTDACVNWEDTVKMLDNLREGVRNRRRRAACESAADFEAKFRVLLTKLDAVENEETWQQIDDALKGLVSLVKAGATKFETFVPTMKPAVKFINSAILSERTRLSGTALMLVEEISKMMETRFTPLSDLIFPTAMKTCGRANKVFVTRGIKCLTTVITYSHLPEQTPRVCDAAMTDVNKTVRSSAAKLLMSIVSCCTVPELTQHLALVEKAIAAGVVDANPDARTTARQSYEIYIKRFSDRVEAFHAGLSSIAKKYLKIEDTSSGRPQSRFAAFRQQQQRQPLRDRPTAQRPNVKPSGAASGSNSSIGAPQQPGSSATAPTAINRPKPVRPMARHGPVAVRRDGTSAPVPLTIAEPSPTLSATAATTAVGIPVLLANGADSAKDAGQEPILTPVAAATAAASAPPTMTSRSSSVEQLIMSPRSSKPTLTRLLADDAPAATDKAPVDSAHASVSPSSTVPASRGASPLDTAPPAAVNDKTASAEEETVAASSKPATPPENAAPAIAAGEKAYESADDHALSQENKKEVPRKSSRTQRTPGLTFSSLSGSTPGARNSRVQPMARPQSRNLVSTRMEEALRAQRPVQSASASASDAEDAKDQEDKQTRRMTLRSAARPPAGAPGYLRATASSAKRGSETVAASASAASRLSKRRKNGSDSHVLQQDAGAADSAAKPAKGATTTRRRSAIKR